MDGVFLETGPFRINKDQTLRPFYGSWNEYANVLYGRYELTKFYLSFNHDI